MKKRLFKMQRHFTDDFSAGVVVFLVALPLCLGIALASGAPLLSGIITGIIAGVIVSWLSGSEMSVSGPAAGLVVVVLSGIQNTGSYQNFLLAVVLSGLFQILFSILRAGSIASFLPNSVINGMLSAIGLIIILKQVPHALGRDKDFEGDLDFWQIIDHENTFGEISKALQAVSPGVIIVSMSAFAILLIWPKISKKLGSAEKWLPASLIAVISGILINELFAQFAPSLFISASEGHLVQLPIINSLSDLKAQMVFPSFDFKVLPSALETALIIAVIGSIETLLCIEAGDKMDPQKRISNGNRELFAQGIGNIAAGMLGGLPMTSVIVRTSANIYAGAKTRASSFFHGLFLLVCAAAIPTILNKIPLGTLAAILIMIGFKLNSLQLWTKTYAKGHDQFIPYFVTTVAIVFSDILTGVAIGLVTSMVFVVKKNFQSSVTLVNDHNFYLIRFTKDVSFASKGLLKDIFRKIPYGSTVEIDGTSAKFIDQDILDLINEFSQGAEKKMIKVNLRNLETQTIKLFSLRKSIEDTADAT